MTAKSITYKIKTAREKDIYVHLYECKDSFTPALDEKVNIRDYATKLYKNAMTFEAWEDQTLVGLIACYFNDIKNHTGYITNVSITGSHLGKGIASELLKRCISYAGENNFMEIILEVFKDNVKAIYLYKKFSFHVFGEKDNCILMKLQMSNHH